MSPTSVTSRPRTAAGTTYAPPRPRRDERPRRTVPVPEPAPGRRGRLDRHGAGRRQSGRLGSRQVVSVRGRRVATQRADPRWWRMVTLAFCMLIAGVGVSMWLSGLSTQQTFEIQQLTAQEAELDNRIETLDRDLEDARSTAGLAERAAGEKLGVPLQAGVLAVDENGEVSERRPAEQETRPIIDVNGDSPRGKAASSNPDKTQGLSENLAPVPQGQTPGQAGAGDNPAARSNPVPYQAGIAR